MQSLRQLDGNDLLAVLGFERRRSPLAVFFAATGYIAAGLLLGTGLALLFAPKSGRQVRQQLREKATSLTEKAGEIAEDVRAALPFGEREAESGSSSHNGPRAKGAGSETNRSSITVK